MKNQNSAFLVFIMSLTTCLLAAYAIFLKHFDGRALYNSKLAILQKELHQERFNNSILAHQLKDLQLAVAQVLPERVKVNDSYALKNFAATVRKPASDDAIDLSPAIYERGKKSFKKREYGQAIESFYKILNKYPLSPHAVEARFFIAESYFLMNDYQNSLEEIDQMVTQFPHHELTGFILLRMGQISESNNQIEEASEIYRMVLRSFKNEELRQQAKKLAQNIEI